MGRALSQSELRAFECPLSPDEEQWPATAHPVWLEQIGALSRHADKEQRLSKLDSRRRALLEQAELCCDQIVDYIADVGSATANQISEAMGINKQMARDRLAKLTEEGRLAFNSTYPRQWKLATSNKEII